MSLSKNAEYRREALNKNWTEVCALSISDNELKEVAEFGEGFKEGSYKNEINAFMEELTKINQNKRWKFWAGSFEKRPFFIHVLWNFLLQKEGIQECLHNELHSIVQGSLEEEIYNSLKMNVKKRKTIISTFIIEYFDNMSISHDYMITFKQKRPKSFQHDELGSMWKKYFTGKPVPDDEDLAVLINHMDDEIQKKTAELNDQKDKSEAHVASLQSHIQDLKNFNAMLKEQLNQKEQHLEEKKSECSRMEQKIDRLAEQMNDIQRLLLNTPRQDTPGPTQETDEEGACGGTQETQSPGKKDLLVESEDPQNLSVVYEAKVPFQSVNPQSN